MGRREKVPFLYAALQHKSPLSAPAIPHKSEMSPINDRRQKLALGPHKTGGNE